MLFVLVHHALTDDAMITLSYARTWVSSSTWGVEPGLVANTQTSPANTVALIAPDTVWVKTAAVGGPTILGVG